MTGVEGAMPLLGVTYRRAASVRLILKIAPAGQQCGKCRHVLITSSAVWSTDFCRCKIFFDSLCISSSSADFDSVDAVD